MVFITHKNFKFGPIMLKLGTGEKILEEGVIDGQRVLPSLTEIFLTK